MEISTLHIDPETPLLWGFRVLVVLGFLTAVAGCFAGALVGSGRSQLAAGWRYVAAFGFGVDCLCLAVLLITVVLTAVSAQWVLAFSAAGFSVAFFIAASGWWRLHTRARVHHVLSLFGDK
jgi:hypothetical protein